MEKQFISDELSSTIAKSWVFSVAPRLEPATGAAPYYGMDHDGTSMQLRLMPYDQNGGGTRSVFNISWPQFDILNHAVDMATTGFLKDKNAGWVACKTSVVY